MAEKRKLFLQSRRRPRHLPARRPNDQNHHNQRANTLQNFHDEGGGVPSRVKSGSSVHPSTVVMLAMFGLG